MVPTPMEINIFTQIGLVVLVGLASKNAILIVEFAKVIHRSGKPIREATLESCRLRLRPIIMTSMAFILGVLPLLNAHGAGAEMRKALGLAVFSRHDRRDAFRRAGDAGLLLPDRHGERVDRCSVRRGCGGSARSFSAS